MTKFDTVRDLYLSHVSRKEIPARVGCTVSFMRESIVQIRRGMSEEDRILFDLGKRKPGRRGTVPGREFLIAKELKVQPDPVPPAFYRVDIATGDRLVDRRREVIPWAVSSTSQ